MKYCNRTRSRRTGGFSLIELVTSAALLAVVLGAIVLMGVTSDRAYDAGASDTRVEAQLRTALDHVVEELQRASLESTSPGPADGVGSSELFYQHALAVTNGSTALSAPRRLAFELDPGEVDDGLDNDGDGLIDEGQLVLTEGLDTDDERRRVLTRWVTEYLEGEQANEADDNGNGLVDEAGFVVEWRGETLLVRMTLAIPDADGNTWVRTGRSSVRIRN